jgi:hypothetical protein
MITSIKQNDSADDFVSNILRNTVRYVRLFELAADNLVPVPTTERPVVNDVFDILQVCIGLYNGHRFIINFNRTKDWTSLEKQATPLPQYLTPRTVW